MSDAVNRLVAVTLDEMAFGSGTPDQRHEREIAIYDLLESNSFALQNGVEAGPYRLNVTSSDGRLTLTVSDMQGRALLSFNLALGSFRTMMRDYQLICESYYLAVKTKTPSQIEAIDMGRRSLHDDAATMLLERLNEHVSVDFNTARRFFSLIVVLGSKAKAL